MSQTIFNFGPELEHLISLIRNAFYPDKEIFLRELILNASDALDKIRFKSVTGYDISREPNLRIRIIPDRAHHTLSVIDTGIGMTKEELTNKLVTIQKPGTKAFIDALKSGTDIKNIGPFNVGFYSAFLVADRVSVISKSDEDGKQWRWKTMGEGGLYSVTDDSQDPEQLVRGTKVVLHLKESDLEFLEENRLREVIQKRCDFIDFPIELQIKRIAGEGEIEPMKKKLETKEEGLKSADIKEEKMKSNKENKVVSYEWEKINKTKPVWMKKPTDLTMAEYAAFYRSLTHDLEGPLAVKHFSAEGNTEFTAILFIPRRAPLDIYTSLTEKRNVRLYVRRVFITDDFEELLPDYLSFVKGVVDTEDLPLNVPQEALHQTSTFKVIRTGLIRKVLELIQEVSHNKEDYGAFYGQFSKNVKLGILEDQHNKGRLAEFLRFYTSRSGYEQVSLKEYVGRMKEDQKEIYFITAESRHAAMSAPINEVLKENGYEVIYMVDPVDEKMVQELKEYDGKTLWNCGKEGVEGKAREQPKMIKEEREGRRNEESLGSQFEKRVNLESKTEGMP